MKLIVLAFIISCALCITMEKFSAREQFLFERLNETNPSPIAFIWSTPPHIRTNVGFQLIKSEKFLAELLTSYRIEDLALRFKDRVIPGFDFNRYVKRTRNKQAVKSILRLDTLQVQDAVFAPLKQSAYRGAMKAFPEEERYGPYHYYYHENSTDNIRIEPSREHANGSFSDQAQADSQSDGCLISKELPGSIQARFSKDQLEEVMTHYKQTIFIEDGKLIMALRGLNVQFTTRYKFMNRVGHAWIRSRNSVLIFPMHFSYDKKTGKPIVVPIIDDGKSGGFFGDIKIRFMDEYGKSQGFLSNIGNFVCDRFTWAFANAISDAIHEEIAFQIQLVMRQFETNLRNDLTQLMFRGEDHGIIPYIAIKDLGWRIDAKNLVISFSMENFDETKRTKMNKRYKKWLNAKRKLVSNGSEEAEKESDISDGSTGSESA